jgi:tol-pal system protein YbgF
MKKLLLPVLLIMLVLGACVSNKKFRQQTKKIQNQEAKLDIVEQEVALNSASIDELINRLINVSEQLLILTEVQGQINESASDISDLEQEITTLKKQIDTYLDGDTITGKGSFGSQADGLQDYDVMVESLDQLRQESAQHATKYELGLLAGVCGQVAETLRDLTLEVQDISGELEGQVTTDMQIAQTRQAALQDILERLSALETDLDTATRELQEMDPGAQDDLAYLRDRVLGVNDGLNDLTSELGQVINQNQLQAQQSRDHAMNKKYQLALAEYYKRDFEESILLFEDFLRSYPEGPLSSNAQYWIGENYYGAEVYAKALRQFLKVAENYPRHKKGWDARLKAGITYYRMGEHQSAYRELMKIKNEFPSYPEMHLVDFFLGKVRP